MTIHSKFSIVFGSLLLAALLFAGVGWTKFTDQKKKREIATIELNKGQNRLLSLQQDIAKKRRNLAEATSELDSLQKTIASESDDPPERNVEIRRWLDRMNQLKKQFDARPDQQIPELRLLEDRDWLLVSKDADFSTAEGIRKALATARTRGKAKLSDILSRAVSKYKEATKTAASSFADLEPYLSSPLSEDIKERYEWIPPADSKSRDLINEKAPIDLDNDVRMTIQKTGGRMMAYPPAAWIDHYAERTRDAFQAYRNANVGQSPLDAAEAAPYYNPPLSAQELDAIRTTEAKPAPLIHY